MAQENTNQASLHQHQESIQLPRNSSNPERPQTLQLRKDIDWVPKIQDAQLAVDQFFMRPNLFKAKNNPQTNEELLMDWARNSL